MSVIRQRLGYNYFSPPLSGMIIRVLLSGETEVNLLSRRDGSSAERLYGCDAFVPSNTK